MDPRIERSRATALTAARLLMHRAGLDAITPSRLAQQSGISRRTIYRLWPTRSELLHDVLVTSSSADYPITNDLRADVRTHLTALGVALTKGPLSRILGALAERAPVDPELAALRARLADSGRAPLLALLKGGLERGDLPTDRDLDLLATELEAPLVYQACVRGLAIDSDFIGAVIGRALPATIAS